MDKAVISGTYADFKIVRTRSVAQIVIEVPIEQGSAFVKAFGLPEPGAERHVALALLADQPSAPEPPKPGQRWDILPLPQQAALRCQDTEFWTFMGVKDADAAAEAVRTRCGVSSRSQLARGTKSGSTWEVIDDAFLEWRSKADARRMIGVSPDTLVKEAGRDAA